MNILFAAAECFPFVKVGGLADVSGALPKAISNLGGAKISIALPYYGTVKIPQDLKVEKFTEEEFDFGGKLETVEVYRTLYPGTNVTVYLFANDKYIAKDSVYPTPFETEINQFFFFCRAILKVLKHQYFPIDVIHLNDWHTAIIASLLKSEYRLHPVLKDISTILTIHNLGHQGIIENSILDDLDIEIGSLQSVEWDAQDKDIDILMQGIINADVISTVSPTYAKEIMSQEYGEGIDNVIKAREGRVFGILNGIDYDVFNPSTDQNIAMQYDSTNWMEGKKQNKIDLLNQIGLDGNSNKPLIGIVSRLSSQKGIELVLKVVDNLIDMGYQIVVLGSGDQNVEKALKTLAEKYPKDFSANLKFDNKLAQKIYAGADLFLIPSKFEPCGLTQMIAMKYGTLPVVRETGGLKDTVDDNRTGFTFKNFDSQEMLDVLVKVNDAFKNKETWAQMVLNAMSKDFSWTQSAKEYFKLYKKAIEFKFDTFR